MQENSELQVKEQIHEQIVGIPGLVVKITSPDTAIHEQNGYAKVYNDQYTFKTNVDNDNSDTTYMTYTNKHKHNMREV